MHNFKGLIVWQKTRVLVKEIYQLTKLLPEDERFGLTSQMRRAAVSILSNIAEGAGRGTDKDFARFLDMAIGSSFELESQAIVCVDLDFIPETEFLKIENQIQEIQRMLYALKSKYS